MEMQNFFKGLLIGFSIAAPVGPISILCIKRTLGSGRLTGIASGLGAATADAFYGSIAAFGISFISNFLIEQQVWLRSIGGLFLCYLGVKTILSKPANTISQTKASGLTSAYGSTFLLTITNPLTILSFAAIFAGLGLGKSQDHYSSAASMVLGVFLGSSLWWIILSSFTGLLR
jgi:threonine/homoserine/homoserine lactone efflux protein